jgi:hypothetical protein
MVRADRYEVALLAEIVESLEANGFSGWQIPHNNITGMVTSLPNR